MTHEYRVVETTERYHGRIFDVVTDLVEMPGGGVAPRDYLKHVGAVGVVALDDEQRVVLVRQYRHPVRRFLWELPAGLVDVAGEEPASTALRELAEEADLTAGRVEHLVDLHTTPGASSEMIRLFLATELREVGHADRHERTDEEAEIEVRRVPLADALKMIFGGEITNGPAVAGLLAADAVLRSRA
ncbi:NUDIX hydrolase [Hamadaea sp.]|uniref:NUDIX domain-containing protein n=1 Tax=Hamadaea sp. TaxID=2024425 RepID=UPI0025C57D79|nr:NUDIX hydrolase [Hamadaea sp.]